MNDQPWLQDACALVEAYRAKVISPIEALEASLAAIATSDLNAFSHLDIDAARRQASHADVSLPFGGVPIGVKELDAVKGWPYTEASLVFQDEISEFDSTQVTRLRRAGAVLAGQTTASEFGGINCTHTKLHGTTRNPWNVERTPGGSSGGSAAAVAGGLLPIATGGDGGGSIRIPAGFTGLFGLKSTYGRIPRGPHTHQQPLTVTVGCLSRSVRDTARWFDVCNGYDSRDTLSLPRVSGWESGLDSFDLANKRAVISIDLGSAHVGPRQTALLTELAEFLIRRAKLQRVDVMVKLPSGGFEWSLSNNVGLVGQLGDRYPDCHDQLTEEIALSMTFVTKRFNLQSAAHAQIFRVAFSEHMAELFDQTDFVFAATNPDVAFNASGPMATSVEGVDLIEKFGYGRALGNNGALTIPANLNGNPAVSVPAGFIDGLPVGLQIIGRHHEEQLLLDLARLVERERPWPLVAPSPASSQIV